MVRLCYALRPAGIQWPEYENGRPSFRLEDLARIYTMVGEYHLALEQIDQLLSMPGLLSVNLLNKDPVWKPLWDLPEFKELIEKYSN